EARAAILADPTTAGEWARRADVDERQLKRAWDRSKPKSKPDSSGDAAVDAEITRLAKLSIVEYERERKAAAKKLALRTDTLEQLVINERARQAYAKEQPAKEEQGRKAKEEAEQLLAELNAENCVVLDGARTLVLRFETDEREVGGEHYVYRLPTFLRFYDFRNLY